MLSVRENTNTIIIKNSKFISICYAVHSIEEINSKLSDIKDRYKDATHVCYAYILDGSIKCSDDGEPSGTAGMPILDVLKKNGLNHVLCIVIRYFGKIKLGAGGLVRAYSNSASECIKDNIINLDDAFFVDIVFSYDNSKIVDNLLLDSVILDKHYSEKITYNAIIKSSLLDNISNRNDFDIIIKDKTYI